MTAITLILALSLLAPASSTPLFEISGVKGPEAVANGIYKQHGAVHGYPCYRNEEKHGLAEHIFLCIDSHGFWGVQPESEVKQKSSNVFFHSATMYHPTPDGAGPWQVWDAKVANPSGLLGSWVMDQAVVVRQLPDPDHPLVKQAISLILFSSLICGAMMALLTSSHDKHLRSQAYWLISAICTVMISYCTAEALHKFLYEQLLPAPVMPGVRIVLNFAIFTCGYFFLTVYGWKCQESEKMLAMNRTLGAHLVAFGGIYTFTIIQYEAVTVLYPQFVYGPILKTADQAKLFLAILTIVLAWFTLALYRWAAVGARSERFYAPPVVPWAVRKAASPPPPPPGRTCTSALGSKTTPLAAGSPQGPDWHDEVTRAEDQASSIILGFLIRQAILFYKTGDLKHVAAPTAWRSHEEMEYCAVSIFVLIVTNVILAVVRIGLKEGTSRIMTIMQRTLAMTLAWLIYTLVRWAVRRQFEDEPLFASTGAAVALILTAMVLVKVADIISDIVNASGNGGGGGQDSLSENIKRTAAGAMGLLVGISWAEVMLLSIRSFIEATPILNKHFIVARFSFTALLAVLIFFPWRKVILPMSLHDEAEHQKGIDLEIKQLSEV